MIKNVLSVIEVCLPLHLPAITRKNARSRGLFPDAVAAESALCLVNDGKDGL